MLRELDFIESDWEALSWALGSTSAIFRHFIPRGLRTWLGKESGREQEPMVKDIGKKAAGIASGVVIAGVVAIGAFGLVRLSFFFFPEWELGGVPWWLAAIVIPEMIFVIAAVALWRKRRLMAVGILLSAATLVTHVIVHVATHGIGQ
jgi:hypothetical protein